MSNRNLTVCLSLILLLGSAFSPLILAPGINNPEPIDPYLNGAFPDRIPATWAWSTFHSGTGMTNVITARRVPGTDQTALGSIDGKIYLYHTDSSNPTPVLLGDIAPDFNFTSNRFGLKGIAFHPEYGQVGSPNSQYIYISYITNEPKKRLSRFTISPSSGQMDLSTELIMIENILPGGSYHSFGEIDFGQDGFLYLPTGDGHGGGFGPYAGSPISDTIMNMVQRIDHNLVGGVLRIDVDKDSTKSHAPRKVLPQDFPDEFSGVGYWIPNDNPWQATDGSLMEEYYSLGHRNPWKLTIDPLTGIPWVGEVGPHNGEELNRIIKGNNYGWPYRVGSTGEINWDRTPPTAPEPNPFLGPLTGPIFSSERSEGRSMMVGCVYRGEKWPELYGKVLTGDAVTGNQWLVDYNSQTGQTDIEELPQWPSRAWTIFESPEGDILMVRTNGTISQLTRNSGTSVGIPARLSETGAFSNLSTLSPASGLIPYTVNTPLWSDRAMKKRWISLANDGTFDASSEQVVFANKDPWQFPEGTVIIKHFELPIDERNPTITSRLETRFLVIGAAGRAYGVTYKWRVDGSDADLVLDGDDQNFTVTDVAGQSYTQTWHYPSTSECLTCHNGNAGYVLGVNTQQLNGDFTYPSSGVTDNQLETWAHLGIFDSPIGEVESLIRNVHLGSSTAINQYKVRSYLDANCAFCHRPGGTDAAFDGRLKTRFESQGLLNTPVQSAGSQGEFVLLAGDTQHSELWVRDNSVGADAMPPLGKSIVDQEYMNVLSEWIEEMNPSVTDTLGEVGSITLTDAWKDIRFNRVYNDPVIVAGAPTMNSIDPVTVRVRNLSPSGCQIRLDEWECQDESHGEEQLTYLVLEAGEHTLPNGKKIMAGTIEADLGFDSYAFPNSFSEIPIVLAQAVTENLAEALTIRFQHTQTNLNGFQLKLQEGQGGDGIHPLETVAWIAAEPGTFDGYLPFEIGNSGQFVEEFWEYMPLSQQYDTPPLFLGQISSNYGGDVCELRHRNVQKGRVEVFLQEETCGDAETGHFKEEVHFIAFAKAGYLLGTSSETGICSSPQNLALAGLASQSSTYGLGQAGLANDGNTTGSSAWSADLQHTQSEFQPWWEVDLGQLSSVGEIQIYNRSDGLQERLKNFYILVSTVPFEPSQSLADHLLDPGITAVFFSGEAGLLENLPLDASGRYIRIQLSENGILHLAEVSIMGCYDANDPCTGVEAVNISSMGPFTENAGIVQLQANPVGGSWSGAVGATGLFDPSQGPGTYAVSYTYSNAGCTQTANAEIVVNPAGGCVSTSNLALNQPAIQSSTYGNGVASFANDGNETGTSPWVADLQHTTNEVNPWWEVDLGAFNQIDQIQIFNRSDGSQSRLKNFYVFASASPMSGVESLADLLNNHSIEHIHFPGIASAQEVLSTNWEGRYVRIQLGDNGILHMAEVQVMGCAGGVDPCQGAEELLIYSVGPFSEDAGIQTLTASPAGGTWSGAANPDGTFDPSQGPGTYTVSYTYTDGNSCTRTTSESISVTPAGSTCSQPENLALDRPTSQSSTYGQGNSAIGVDGDIDGTRGPWGNASIAHTQREDYPWWEVDLGIESEIQELKIFNRTDCCQDRLKDFYVFVSDVPFEQGVSLNELTSDNAISRMFFSGVAGNLENMLLNATGRYFRVQLSSPNEILHFAEIEIMGCSVSQNIRLGRSTESYTSARVSPEIQVFPIPTQQELTIQVLHAQSEDFFSYELYSLSGQQLWRKQGQNRLQVHLGDLAQGIYLLKVQGIDWTKVQQVLVE
ncbi:MAG: discoidin domain-containing protein [Bacteroidota bacterium]